MRRQAVRGVAARDGVTGRKSRVVMNCPSKRRACGKGVVNETRPWGGEGSNSHNSPKSLDNSVVNPGIQWKRRGDNGNVQPDGCIRTSEGRPLSSRCMRVRNRAVCENSQAPPELRLRVWSWIQMSQSCVPRHCTTGDTVIAELPAGIGVDRCRYDRLDSSCCQTNNFVTIFCSLHTGLRFPVR